MDGQAGAPARVLLADDDPDARLLYGTGLQTSGFHVILAEGGDEALAMAFSQHPDVLVLDVDMPDVNGVEVLRRVRASDAADARTPVLMLTNVLDLTLFDECRDLGALWLEKHKTTPRNLVDTVREALAPAGS